MTARATARDRQGRNDPLDAHESTSSKGNEVSLRVKPGTERSSPSQPVPAPKTKSNTEWIEKKGQPTPPNSASAPVRVVAQK